MTVVIAAAVFAACLLGGTVGFAAGVIALPILLVGGYTTLDAVYINLCIGLVTRSTVAVRLRKSVHARRTCLLVAGTLPGAALGSLVVGHVEVGTFKLLIGVLVLMVAPVVLLQRSPSRIGAPMIGSIVESPRHLLITGGVSGLLGVATSLTGIAPALLFLRAQVAPREFIADLAAFFAFTHICILVMLWTQAPMSQGAAVHLVVLLPVALVGNAVGHSLSLRIPVPTFRTIAVFAIVGSGVLAVLSSL